MIGSLGEEAYMQNFTTPPGEEPQKHSKADRSLEECSSHLAASCQEHSLYTVCLPTNTGYFHAYSSPVPSFFIVLEHIYRTKL
jgi:hypothetical protein